MASESLSRGVDLFFAQEFCFLIQEHGPPRGSKQAKTDVLLTTVLGSLRCDPCGRTVLLSHVTLFAFSVIATLPTLTRPQIPGQSMRTRMQTVTSETESKSHVLSI